MNVDKVNLIDMHHHNKLDPNKQIFFQNVLFMWHPVCALDSTFTYT